MVANCVAIAGTMLNSLMADGAVRCDLAESEIAVDGGEADEELALRLAAQLRLGLLLVNVTVEPLLAEGITNAVQESMAVLVRGRNGAEPVQEATKIVDVDGLRRFDEVTGLVLADKQGA